MVARGEFAGFAAGAERIGRRQWLLQRPRPHRHGTELVMAALPAKGLRLGPGLEDQFHAFGRALARFRRIEAIGQVFVGRSAQQPDDEAPLRQIVEHRQFFGDLHRVALRDDWAKHRDLYLFRPRRHVGGRNRSIRRQYPRRIMVLGDTDPVEAELLDIERPVDHALVSLGAGIGIVSRRRDGPFSRHCRRHLVARGFKI